MPWKKRTYRKKPAAVRYYELLERMVERVLVDEQPFKPERHKRQACIYMIGGFYVGKTKNLTNRIYTHLAFLYGAAQGSSNKEKDGRLRELFEAGEPIRFTVLGPLSETGCSERCFIELYRAKGYELVNKAAGDRNRRERWMEDKPAKRKHWGKTEKTKIHEA